MVGDNKARTLEAFCLMGEHVAPRVVAVAVSGAVLLPVVRLNTMNQGWDYRDGPLA